MQLNHMEHETQLKASRDVMSSLLMVVWLVIYDSSVR